jgi:hypothetical protein
VIARYGRWLAVVLLAALTWRFALAPLDGFRAKIPPMS